MCCKFCNNHNEVPRNGSGKRVIVGCTPIRCEKIKVHEHSSMHKEAERARLDETAAEASSAIHAALQ